MPLDVLSVGDLTTGVPVIGPVSMSVDPDVAWPFVPNWRSDVAEEYEYNTDIFTSRSHREQRRAIRDEPRKRWEFTSVVHGANYRESMALVSSRFDSLFYVVNPIYSVALAAPFAELDSTMTVESVPGWLAVDAVIFITNGTDQRLYRVAAVDGVSVTVGGVAAADWPAGARVRLGEPVYTDTLRTTAETASVTTLRNVLAVDPAYPLYSGASVAGPTFNGRELFLKTPNWREAVTLDLETDREAVDYGHGRIAYFSPVPFVLRNQKLVFLGRDLEETEAVVNFFRRMKGQLNEFYMPTYTSDIVPIAALSGASLTTEGQAYYGAFNSPNLVDSAAVLKAVIVWLANGTYLTRLISSVTLSGGNSVFNMAAAWGSVIPVSNIRKISFLPVCRFATDKLAVEWKTNRVAQFTVTVKALEAL